MVESIEFAESKSSQDNVQESNQQSSDNSWMNIPDEISEGLPFN